MAGGFKKTHGWSKFEKAIEATRFTKRITDALDKATGIAAKLVAKRIKEIIRDGKFEENAELTLELKRPQVRPLAGTSTGGWLLPSIVAEKMAPMTWFVGVTMKDAHFNIAVAIHEGTDIKVSEKMRGLFAVLANASKSRTKAASLTGRAAELFKLKPGGWFPLNPGTTIIRIPPRQFAYQAFDEEELKTKIQELWARAIAIAIKKAG